MGQGMSGKPHTLDRPRGVGLADRVRAALLAIVVVAAGGCTVLFPFGAAPDDAGSAGSDAGRDAGLDAGGTDAGLDGGGSDASVDAGCDGAITTVTASADLEIDPGSTENRGGADTLTVGLDGARQHRWTVLAFPLPEGSREGLRATVRLDRVVDVEDQEMVCDGACPTREGTIVMHNLELSFVEDEANSQRASAGVPWDLQPGANDRGVELGEVAVGDDDPSFAITLTRDLPEVGDVLSVLLVSEQATFVAWSKEGSGLDPLPGEEPPRLEVQECP